MSTKYQQIHLVIKDDNCCQPWLLFSSLKIRIVTLETSFIRTIKFSRLELHLSLLNNAILFQCLYYISNF